MKILDANPAAVTFPMSGGIGFASIPSPRSEKSERGFSFLSCHFTLTAHLIELFGATSASDGKHHVWTFDGWNIHFTEGDHCTISHAGVSKINKEGDRRIMVSNKQFDMNEDGFRAFIDFIQTLPLSLQVFCRMAREGYLKGV